MIRNALASLTQAELIRQPSSEFEGTGKHRLVKVANQDKLVELASQLGIKVYRAVMMYINEIGLFSTGSVILPESDNHLHAKL